MASRDKVKRPFSTDGRIPRNIHIHAVHANACQGTNSAPSSAGNAAAGGAAQHSANSDHMELVGASSGAGAGGAAVAARAGSCHVGWHERYHFGHRGPHVSEHIYIYIYMQTCEYKYIYVCVCIDVKRRQHRTKMRTIIRGSMANQSRDRAKRNEPSAKESAVNCVE